MATKYQIRYAIDRQCEIKGKKYWRQFGQTWATYEVAQARIDNQKAMFDPDSIWRIREVKWL